MAEEFCLPLRVYIEDTDAGGIVYYVNYLKFMERARTEFMRSLGFGKGFIFNAQLMFVVRDVNVRYHAPAQLDDELTSVVSLTRVGGAALDMHQQVRRGETVLTTADVKIASVNRDTMKPARLPAAMIAVLKQRLDQQGNKT
jgi:4-hydroxybenzoyl-CoA thioesterase